MPRLPSRTLPTIFALWSSLAHADTLHVRDVLPSAGAVLTGDHAEYVIRFDGLVDHMASRLYVTQSGRLVQSLTPRRDSAPEVLFAGAETPPPGDYQLHWEAISVGDGTVSSGEIPFSVAP